MWSDIKVINTHDNQELQADSMGHHAQIITKKNEKWANFEKPGLIYSTYGYMYGTHRWEVLISCQTQYAYMQDDYCGQMLIGVFNNKSRSSKVYGSLVPFTLEKGLNRIEVKLETEKKRLIVYGPNN